MSASETPRAMRFVIALVGCRNAGKSSLINALTGQEISIVSDIAGTTTDAVAKAYELLPLGPVTFYDTAGLDDDSSLGQQRIAATHKALYKADVTLMVVGENGWCSADEKIAAQLKEMKIPTIVVFNKSDKAAVRPEDVSKCHSYGFEFVSVSAEKGQNIDNLKNLIVQAIPEENKKETPLLGDLVTAKDSVVLVTPIDTSAPKGRLILPQVQILREILDCKAFAHVTQTDELPEVLASLQNKPKIVITDSQAVFKVNQLVPNDIALTTFSILFARFKGDLKIMVNGAKQLDNLPDNARILIAEACSHHAQDDDIARVKIPNWLRKYTQKELNFAFCTGCDFPDDLEKYNLIVHCGACMLNRMEMNRRLKECVRRGVPITNYGVAISKAQGILERVIKPFDLNN
jgi:[FeFe] hydrogenase H-cluster maturation GTPase HydF